MINFEDLPKSIQDDMIKSKGSSDMTFFLNAISEHKERSFNVVIAPPRFFPEKSWYYWLMQFDLWIPVLTCIQHPSWMSMNIDGITLSNFPLEENDGVIDSWDLDPKKCTGGKLENWLKEWTRDLSLWIGNYRNFKEAEEIISIEIRKCIADYSSSREQKKRMLEENNSDFISDLPVISNLLVRSANRVGTGMVRNINEWPIFLWPEKITGKNGIKMMPFYPKTLDKKEDFVDFFVEPVDNFLRKVMKNKSINYYIDGASGHINGSLVILKDVGKRKGKKKKFFYNKDDVEFVSKPKYNEMNFSGRSILCDIAETCILDLGSKWYKAISETALELK